MSQIRIAVKVMQPVTWHLVDALAMKEIAPLGTQEQSLMW